VIMFSDAALAKFRDFARTAGLHQSHPLAADQHEPKNGSGPIDHGNPPPTGPSQHQQALADLGGQSVAQQRELPRDQSTTGAGTPASAGAGPSIADQHRTMVQTSKHGSGDQTSGGEQQLREVCERLRLPPEICDRILSELSNGNAEGAEDEPPPFEGRPNVGAGANKPAEGGLRSPGAQDSAQRRAPPAPRLPALDSSVGIPDPHCPSLDRAVEEVYAAHKNGKERALQERKQLAQDAYAGEATFLADCPFVRLSGKDFV
jgi:hypothetical protein